MTMSSHGQRWLTSLLLLPLLALILYLGGWWLFFAVALVSCIAQFEFYTMFWRDARFAAKIVGLALGILILVLGALGHPLWGGGLLLAVFWILQLRFLFQYSSAPHMADYQSKILLLCGLLYIPVSLQCFLFLGPIEILFVMLTTFASDTGAYYAGSILSGPKVWPAISPKKTWAGSFGGLAVCLLITAFFALFLPPEVLQGAGFWTWLGLGLALNLAAQYGDFFESALKRSLDIKDSGAFLPGHGGMLDRIDGMLLALPVYMLIRSLYLL